eukprot:TRINITY_DN27071_c0_g1_i1.p1 TRINITY_DN27071_c0_g1~~TRINITY_DN27071_c0_g1_i1.p1  ORF type:complete len:164 (+),score=12.86 TRINITY_DN27071_c0_g1_i1:384-875(+)
MKEALIDTDILSFFFRGDEKVGKKIVEYKKEYEKLNLSIITQYEVIKGLEYKQAESQIKRFSEFIETNCVIVNLSEDSIKRSAKIYGDLRRKGVTVGSLDILIAGIAIENKLQLITNNEKHYQDIDGLEFENWRKQTYQRISNQQEVRQISYPKKEEIDIKIN